MPDRSFFLFGPRGVGKSTWLNSVLPKSAQKFDLLNTRLYLELARDPNRLEALISPKTKSNDWICIDEVQKIPALLDEVHRLMEERGYRFALSGSSARKLKRAGANLLASRAITRRLGPFCSAELGESFDFERALEFGLLPMVYLNPKDSEDILEAYVQTYIREEVKEEGLVRKVEPFLRFLEVAGIYNGQQVNGESLAREAQVPRASIDNYFSILEDTLLGTWLRPYRPLLKVREQTHPKFYWFDPGVARAAVGMTRQPIDSVWKGTALETLILHELRTFSEISNLHFPISFYRTASGTEIDFILELRRRTTSQKAKVICIEIKAAKRWDKKWEGPMRSLASSDKIEVHSMIGVYLGREELTFDRLRVLPLQTFLKELYNGVLTKSKRPS